MLALEQWETAWGQGRPLSDTGPLARRACSAYRDAPDPSIESRFQRQLAKHIMAFTERNDPADEILAEHFWRDIGEHGVAAGPRILALVEACRKIANARQMFHALPLVPDLHAAVVAVVHLDREQGTLTDKAKRRATKQTALKSDDALLLYDDGRASSWLREAIDRHPSIAPAIARAELQHWWKHRSREGKVDTVCQWWASGGRTLARLKGVWRTLACREGGETPIAWTAPPPKIDIPYYTPDLVAAFVLAFAQRGQSEMVQEVWSSMRARGLHPTPQVWLALLDGHLAARRPKLDRVRDTVTQMAIPGIVLPTETKIELVDHLLRCSRGQDETAKALLDDLINRVADTMTADQASKLVAVLGRGQRVQQALRFVEAQAPRFPSDGPFRLVDALLRHCLAQANDDKDYEPVIPLLDQLRDSGVSPSEDGLASLAKGYLSSGKHAEAHDLLDQLFHLPEPPSRALLEALLLHCMRLGTLPGAETAANILDTLGEFGYPRSLYMYTAVIQAYCRIERASIEAMACADGMLKQMRAAQIEPSRLTYTELLRGHLRLGTREGTARALAIFEALEASRYDRATVPTVSSLGTPWCVLLEGLEANGEPDELRRRLDVIKASGVEPSGALGELVARLEGCYGTVQEPVVVQAPA
jgi:hypothetical protein